jgi:hypothetical protein
LLSRDKTLPEFEFDRRVAFWAMTRTDPPTATIRLNLFEQHLHKTLETDGNTDQALRRIAAHSPHDSSRWERRATLSDSGLETAWATGFLGSVPLCLPPSDMSWFLSPCVSALEHGS